jgi:hypothetical protein
MRTPELPRSDILVWIFQSLLVSLFYNRTRLKDAQLFHTPDNQVVAGSRNGHICIVGDLLEIPAFFPGQERDDALIAYLLARYLGPTSKTACHQLIFHFGKLNIGILRSRPTHVCR